MFLNSFPSFNAIDLFDFKGNPSQLIVLKLNNYLMAVVMHFRYWRLLLNSNHRVLLENLPRIWFALNDIDDFHRNWTSFDLDTPTSRSVDSRLLLNSNLQGGVPKQHPPNSIRTPIRMWTTLDEIDELVHSPMSSLKTSKVVTKQQLINSYFPPLNLKGNSIQGKSIHSQWIQ